MYTKYFKVVLFFLKTIHYFCRNLLFIAMNSQIRTFVRPEYVIAFLFFVLACLYFSPLSVPYKGAYPLAFLTLCSLRYACWPMALAMFFSALGDWMGICHNFWAQMGAFAMAHVAYLYYFGCTCRKEWTTDKIGWKLGGVALYGVLAGGLIVPHVQGVLQIGVSVYVLLILAMCALAWIQKNRYYALGAWLFMFSDTVLAWNKFVSPIEYVGYFIMVPYYLGQLILFVQSVGRKKNSGID